jgi:hypothetical protein
VACMRWWWQGGAFDCASRGRGFGAISPKPSCWGSVLGGPLETAMEGDGRR